MNQLNFIDTNQLIIISGAAVILLGLGMAVYAVLLWVTRRKKMTNRMDDFVTSEIRIASQKQKGEVIPREVKGSFYERTLAKWFIRLIHYLGSFTPDKMAIELERKLATAGNPSNLNAGSFYAMRFMFFMISILLAFFFNRDLQNIQFKTIMLGVLIMAIGYIYPSAWLNKRVRIRQDEIRRGLPDALDMLSVCASAGLGFDQSLQKISQFWNTEFGHELTLVTHEMEMGVPRAAALRNLSNRLDVDDLTRFVAILIQAEKIGMSYAAVLHNQAEQLRILRQLRAREIANQLPAKMIVPLALLIFPAMIAVILGPAIPLLLEMF